MSTHAEKLAARRDYKSRLFIMVFSDKEKLLELYNAVSGRNYDNPEELTINTLDNAIYMSMKNDVSFLIDSRQSLYEHQSTYNPNIPLRFLFYMSDVYSELTLGKNLYGTVTIPLPTPKFVVFYNGLTEMPDHDVMRLSDAFIESDEKVSLELKVDVFNINVGHNEKMMEACKTLKEYSEYVYRVRKYAQDMDIEDAVECAVNECIRENILKNFLEKNRAEAIAVSIYEYNQEEHIRMEREQAQEEANARAEAEKARAEEANARAEAEKARADAALAENARLREEIERLKNKIK